MKVSLLPEHGVWRSMKSRCSNPNDKGYPYYGGRGITVCERWMTFENFINDMGYRPSDKHSIDRIDNNAGYSPENCRWTTRLQQSANRSNAIMVDGMCLREYCDKLGVSYKMVHLRITRYGYSLQDAVSKPPKR